MTPTCVLLFKLQEQVLPQAWLTTRVIALIRFILLNVSENQFHESSLLASEAKVTTSSFSTIPPHFIFMDNMPLTVYDNQVFVCFDAVTWTFIVLSHPTVGGGTLGAKRFWTVELLKWGTTGGYCNFTRIIVFELARRNVGLVAPTNVFDVMV